MCGDARLARIRLSGPAALQIAAYPEDTWSVSKGKFLLDRVIRAAALSRFSTR